MIYISSGCFKTTRLRETVDIANKLNFPVELSFLDHEDDIENILRDIKVPFILHNYFPRPAQDFTINLASSNAGIRVRSVEHCLGALKLSEKFNIPYFGIHAGYRCDVKPRDLGKSFSNAELAGYEASMNFFKESLGVLGESLKDMKVKLLLENNSVIKENISIFGENPLLMCSPSECLEVFGGLDKDRFGILLDTGHLKISANSLGFEAKKFFDECGELISGYHLSDNDGITDSHSHIQEDSWFLPYIEEKKYVTVEIRPSEEEVIRSQIKLIKKRYS